MAIVKQPAAIHTAFNSNPIQVITPNGDYAEIQIQTADELIDAQTITLTRDGYIKYDDNNTLCTFSPTNTVRKLFSTRKKNLNEYIRLDGALCVKYQVKELHPQASTPIDLTAVNAVSQIGESTDWTKRRGTFLTGFQRLKKYPGYELDVAFLGYAQQTYIRHDDNTIFDDIVTHALTSVPDNVRKLSIATAGTFETLTTNQAETITDNQGNVILVRAFDGTYTERNLYVENLPVPQNPFYVRWINRLGGYDYYMFSYRQKIQRTTTNMITFNPYYDEEQAAQATMRTIGMTATQKVTAGCENITNSDYDNLARIIFSPKIEWYNQELGKWIIINIDKGDTSCDTHYPAQQFETTFILPSIQTQT